MPHGFQSAQAMAMQCSGTTRVIPARAWKPRWFWKSNSELHTCARTLWLSSQPRYLVPSCKFGAELLHGKGYLAVLLVFLSKGFKLNFRKAGPAQEMVVALSLGWQQQLL